MHMHPIMTFRQWMHHPHFMGHHPALAKMEHMLHTPTFWMIVVMVLLAAMFIMLAAASGGATMPYSTYTTYPGMPGPFIQ